MGQRRHYIREWRKHRGLTIDQLAGRIELTDGKGDTDFIDKTYLGRIEREERPYNQPILEQAAAALECEVPELFSPPVVERAEDDLTRHLKKLKTKADRARAARILAAAFGSVAGEKA